MTQLQLALILLLQVMVQLMPAKFMCAITDDGWSDIWPLIGSTTTQFAGIRESLGIVTDQPSKEQVQHSVYSE